MKESKEGVRKVMKSHKPSKQAGYYDSGWHNNKKNALKEKKQTVSEGKKAQVRKSGTGYKVYKKAP